MVRIFLPSAKITDKSLTIEGEKAHYLLSVLRCRQGDNFIVFDGKGNCFMALIRESGRRRAVADILEVFPCDLESPLRSILVQGILRGEKMDMVIQKTTELGISEVVPAITERSQLRDTRKGARWRKIAEEAARQSGRSLVPVVHEPVELREYLTSPAFQPPHQGIIFYEEEGMTLSEVASHFIPHPSSILVVIGPEGGFSKEEVAFAKERGLKVVSLGKRVLRAETAAIASLTLVQYLFGDMG